MLPDTPVLQQSKQRGAGMKTDTRGKGREWNGEARSKSPLTRSIIL